MGLWPTLAEADLGGSDLGGSDLGGSKLGEARVFLWPKELASQRVFGWSAWSVCCSRMGNRSGEMAEPLVLGLPLSGSEGFFWWGRNWPVKECSSGVLGVLGVSPQPVATFVSLLGVFGGDYHRMVGCLEFEEFLLPHCSGVE